MHRSRSLFYFYFSWSVLTIMNTRFSDGHGGGGGVSGDFIKSRTPGKQPKAVELSDEDLALSLELLRKQFLIQAGLSIQSEEIAVTTFRRFSDILRKNFGKEGKADWKEAASNSILTSSDL